MDNFPVSAKVLSYFLLLQPKYLAVFSKKWRTLPNILCLFSIDIFLKLFTILFKFWKLWHLFLYSLVILFSKCIFSKDYLILVGRNTKIGFRIETKLPSSLETNPSPKDIFSCNLYSWFTGIFWEFFRKILLVRELASSSTGCSL